MKDGVYYDLDEEIYHAMPRFSASGIKQILVSPMDFWIRSWMNPNRTTGKKRAFEIGKAYDKLIIDGKEAFDAKYALPFDPEEYPDAMVTADDYKEELRTRDLAVGGNKPELLQRLRDNGCDRLDLDSLKANHAVIHNGKEFLSLSDYEYITNAGLYMQAQASNPFKDGKPQVSVLWTDEETGVPMKARYDYLKPGLIVDLKTFSNGSGFPVDIAVARSIATYKYHIQAATYLDSHKIMFGAPAKFQFIFVHSGATLLTIGKNFKAGSLLHTVGHSGYRRGIELFQLYYNRFGDKPWIDDLSITDLDDTEMPAYVFD